MTFGLRFTGSSTVMPPTYTPTRTMKTARWLDGALHPDVQYKALGWGFVTENILFSVCYSEQNTFYPSLLIIRFVIYFVSYRMSEGAISLSLAAVIQASILVYRGAPTT